MANTLIPIQTVTVGAGGQAAIEFTNISQDYTDLYIVASTRATATDTPVKVEFNNVTTGYSWRRLYGSGSAASSLSGTDAYYFWTATSSQTAATFGSGQLYIPNYTSSNNKSISTESLNENNGTAADMFMTAALWSNSAAITSVKLTPLTGSFAQYSTATLHGVTSAGYGAKATGGIISQDETYWYHTFAVSGTFTPSQNLSCDLIMIGGGGSGNVGTSGTFYGGGGGAGQVLNYTSQSLTASSNYTVTIGGGGSPISGTTLNVNGNAGTATQFTGLTSANGGGGALYSTGFGGTSGNGFAGGSPSGALCGGGGGSGAVGGNAPGSNSGGGDGGPGTTSYGTWLPVQGLGELISGSYYIGGGGAGSYPNGQGGYGGGGGDGAFNFDVAIMAGKINTGSGGCGGNYSNVASGAGGSGVVIVRYAK